MLQTYFKHRTEKQKNADLAIIRIIVLAYNICYGQCVAWHVYMFVNVEGEVQYRGRGCGSGGKVRNCCTINEYICSTDVLQISKICFFLPLHVLPVETTTPAPTPTEGQ